MGAVVVAEWRGALALAAASARMARSELAVVASLALADSGLPGPGLGHAAAGRVSSKFHSTGTGCLECIFHALQNVQDYFKEVYGPNYTETHPEAEVLKQEIYHIFDARTKRTAQKRYDKVMALRERTCKRPPPQQPSSTSWSGTGLLWSAASRVRSYPGPTTQWSWSFGDLTSTTRTSAASIPLRPPGSSWASSRRCTASPHSREMPSPGFGANARWSWPATTSARCRWLPSAPASALPGLWRLLRTLSPTRDGRVKRI